MFASNYLKCAMGAGIAGLLCSCADTEHSQRLGPSLGQIIPGRHLDARIVDNKVYFDFDSSALRKDAHATLVRQAQWILRYINVPITVAGNTDERGSEEYNLALGYRRAEAVRNFLVAEGVPSKQIRVVSYGKERPIALGTTDADYARNRNVISSDGVGPDSFIAPDATFTKEKSGGAGICYAVRVGGRVGHRCEFPSGP